MAELEFTNKLLKEAIADAEAVRQTAIENAKLSLEETFAPHIKSVLENNLRYEADDMDEASEVPHEDGEPEGSSDMPADSSDIGNGENAEPSDDAFDSAEDDMSGEGHTNSSSDWYADWSENDFDLAEVIKELEEDVNMLNEEDEEESEDEDEEESEDEDEEEESEDEDEEESEDEDEDGEYPEGEPAGDEDSDEDIPAKSSGTGEEGAQTFTLEEFVSMMDEAGYNMEEVFAPAQYADVPSAPPMEESYTLEELVGLMGEAGYGVDEGFMDAVRGVGRLAKVGVKAAQQGKLKKFGSEMGKGVKSSYKQGAMQSGDKPDSILGGIKQLGKDFSSVGKEKDFDAEKEASSIEETDLNLEEILAELEAEEAHTDASDEMASEVQALHEQLAEYRTAVNILRGKLFEVNLLNAKLLYTNKIFRKEGLHDDQKIKIVENFDRATTVREVKMVYTVLAESLVPRNSVKTSTAKATKKVVAEGLASKQTRSTAPKATTPEIISENSVARRLQQLAGIIS